MSIPDHDQQLIPASEVTAGVPDDWRVLLTSLHARFATGNFLSGLRFVTRVAAVAEEANHHPDVDLRYPHVDVALTSHDVHGLTARDVRLATRISQIAAEEGAPAKPRAVQTMELALDTPAADRVRPFWAAIMGAEPRSDSDQVPADEVVDPAGRLPNLWFQPTESDEPHRQRFHYDVIVPHDQARARVAAAIDAGGELVSDAEAPAFWVIADADGNRACVCTWQNRDGQNRDGQNRDGQNRDGQNQE